MVPSFFTEHMMNFPIGWRFFPLLIPEDLIREHELFFPPVTMTDDFDSVVAAYLF